MYQPRLSEMNRQQRQSFNEMKKILKQGKIPAALINPALIRKHNENSPAVAHIKNGGDNVSLDSLLLHYLSDSHIVRKYWRDTVHSSEALELDDTFAPVAKDLNGLSRKERRMLMMENNSYE